MATTDRDNNPPEAPFRDQAGNGVALLIVDMISQFDFAGAEALLPRALEVAKKIDALRQAAHRRGWPIIFVNDNFGEWHSEKSRLVAEALKGGNPIVERLKPADDEYFIIKPQLSAFYATNLPVLIPKLGVRRLILTGMATEMCVLFTAADAYMRDYKLWIPRDTVVASDERRAEAALEIMGRSLKCEVAATNELPVDTWASRSK